jgi:hypothetical protein
MTRSEPARPSLQRPDHARLDAARQLGDPEADAVVEQLGDSAWRVNASLRHVHKNSDPLPLGLPGCVVRFLEQEVVVPTWLDERRVRRAQTWAQQHLFEITVALFCASLPTSYGGARGARVLAGTGRMQGPGLDRRINETAQFVLDVVAEGSLGPDGCGLRSIQKVRLMHAAVRGHLRGRPGFTDEVPINQEDLLGTLFSFSLAVIRAMERLGADVDDERAEDYLHLWCAVGAMLGVRQELLPTDLRSGFDIAERVAERNLQASEHGQALMASLLAGMEDHVPGARWLPRYLVRHLVGDHVADLLAIPASPRAKEQLALVRFLPRRPASAMWRRFSALVGRPLLEAVVAAKLHGAPPAFAMPGQAAPGSCPPGAAVGACYAPRV